ncbi:DUF4118 domain-containing protein [Novosphingobium sp.]|uniref:sensor histidine kinase n=1 Tax=Novosphingobium sp. TaxID=1874826 RepID=UPI0027338CBD|nr:DUF4118 domain-containing protein [Novosphingobium sp.]MDP3907311.1 DUF4118 domain-containing protein [Novosphingobium sp.]
MNRSITPWLEALLAVAAIIWLTAAQLPVLGLASSALLFLLPVLMASVRGGVGPGLFAAIAGAASYNFFLLEPRYTFRVHQLDNLISVLVLVALALVTSRLASRLMQREAEAQERAKLSAECAEISSLLAGQPPQTALVTAASLIETRYGKLILLSEGAMPNDGAAFSSLDVAAAAWAAHNGDITGHGSEVMPAADWTFLPLALKNERDGRVAALARPMDGTTRPTSQIDHLQQLTLLLGQGLDREALEIERREREMLEERDHLRRAFLASLAHDFRTPLTVISGRLSVLAQKNSEARDALAAAQRLDRMMNDLIGAARIEGGSLTPHLENIDLIDVVSIACEDLQIPPQITLNRNVPADLPFVIADPVLLRHVLANLIDNAFRHANSTVTISADGEGNCVSLKVGDDGPGVPSSEQARIFERFARAEGSDRTDGSGLGLAIVKGFADAMAMSVTIENMDEGGARFALAIPMAAKAVE